MQNNYVIKKVNVNQIGKRLDKVLGEFFPNRSRSQIVLWIINEQVKVGGVIVKKPKKKCLKDEIIEVCVINDIDTKFLYAQNIALDIIYEDADIIVINKPYNMVVHPGAGNVDGTIFNALLYYYPPIVKLPRAGIVHRLDKNTTGLMIIAKTISAQTNLTYLLKKRKIIREYEAIVTGILIDKGVIDRPIARHKTKRIKMAIDLSGKPAITHYRVIENFRAHTRLRLRLETGRTHQIRVHMSHIKHPLVGDKLYFAGKVLYKAKEIHFTLKNMLDKFNRQALHATMIKLCHPVTNIEMEWNVSPPEDMIALISALKIDTLTKN